MNSRKEFSDLFNNTVIPASMADSEKNKLYHAIDTEALKILPQSLFRYRTCNENNMSSFENDEIWFSTADCMNDGFDARAYVSKENKDRVINQVEKVFHEYDMERKTAFIEKELLPKVRPKTGHLISLIPEWFEHNKDDLLAMAKGEILSKTISVPIIAQCCSRVCCFSETVRSSAMWGLYGKDETGFCLEYDFRKPPHVYPESYECLLYPVVYSNQRLEIPFDYLNYLLWNTLRNQIGLASEMGAEIKEVIPVLDCPDLMLATKIIMNKSDAWGYEEEWRLMLSNVDFNDSKHHAAIKKSTALYLGRRIAPINEKLLCLVAREKDIPVYKMQIDDSSPHYWLNYNRIQ